MKSYIMLLFVAGLYFLSSSFLVAEAATLEHLIRHHYEQFRTKYAQTLLSAIVDELDSERFITFAKNFEHIEMFNYEAETKNLSFKLAVNRFSDMKYSEFAQKFTGLIPESQASTLIKSGRSLSLGSRIERQRRRRPTTTIKPTKASLPDSIDWRDQNVVTPVKYQGMCGSCWAFSAVAALESHYAIKTGRLIDLSEQQLVDCSSNGNYGNAGCSGGLMTWAFDYIIGKGEMEESDYKYSAKQGSCKYSGTKAMVHMSSYERISSEDEMMKVVGTLGPITVAIFASANFQSYASGVFDDPLCTSQSTPNHAVVVVGYGSENGKDYWIVKNSWGEDWGEKGYAKFLRGVNMCKIENEVHYPIV